MDESTEKIISESSGPKRAIEKFLEGTGDISESL